METKELLLHLIKKLEDESGGGMSLECNLKEVKDEYWKLEFWLETDNNFENDGKEIKIHLGEFKLYKTSPYVSIWDATYLEYNEEKNEEFKKNFYKEKGVKCWVSDCPNKILQQEGDHKKVKVPCSEKHTRLVCMNCSKKYE